MSDLKATIDSTLWVEKYKPATIDDVIIEHSLKTKFKEYITTKDIPCLLFAGAAGVGKTSCAKLIARSISEDVMFINASSESGIDVVRHKIEPFCVTQSFSDGFKVVILDEMEMSSDNFQTALREVIEKFYSTTRFILTCNFVNKVIEPLKSRTQEYKFGNINQVDILKRCLAILDAEKVEYDKKNVGKVVKNLGTDVRRIINALQRLTAEVDGKKVLMNYTTTEEKQAILLDYVKTGKLSDFRKFIGEHNLPVEEVAKFLFNKSFDKQISEKNWIECVVITGDIVNSMKNSIDPEITLIHGVLQLIKLI
jgi:replication factor C small subunit